MFLPLLSLRVCVCVLSVIRFLVTTLMFLFFYVFLFFMNIYFIH